MSTQLKNGEQPEFPVSGPFGGIQSEAPLEAIEQLGFADADNIMFRLGAARVRPAFGTCQQATPWSGILPVTAPYLVTVRQLSGTVVGLTGVVKDLGTDNMHGQVGGGYENWTGFFDFYGSGEDRFQVATTNTQVYFNSPSGWIRLYVLLHGNNKQFMSFAVVGQQVCMSNGVDPIYVWNGATKILKTAWDPVKVETIAPPTRYMFEFGNHLIALNTIEEGGHAYQRVHWSGVGEPLDWTSLGSGTNDLFNDLGPIRGGMKLGLYGFVFQQFGFVKMQLTGNGLQPFFFQPISSRSKGLAIPRTLAANGETSCLYVGEDNVYMFDGASHQPIGDMPLQGRAKSGARQYIFSDLAATQGTYTKPGAFSDGFGFVTMNINGTPFNAYWLVIPGVAIWILNLDEMNWTRWTINGLASCIGNFLTKTVVRVADLVGTVATQEWTPATLNNDNPFTNVVVAFGDGTLKMFDFSGWSEKPWLIKTGQMQYDDPRHSSVTKKLRLQYTYEGDANINLTFENERDEVFTFGSTKLKGTRMGKTYKTILPVNLAGELVEMTISGDAGVPFVMNSFAPTYSSGGEVRETSTITIDEESGEPVPYVPPEAPTDTYVPLTEEDTSITEQSLGTSSVTSPDFWNFGTDAHPLPPELFTWDAYYQLITWLGLTGWVSVAPMYGSNPPQGQEGIDILQKITPTYGGNPPHSGGGEEG